MRAILGKIIAFTANVALMAVVFAADIPSMGGLHQPKEPANIEAVVKNHKKA